MDWKYQRIKLVEAWEHFWEELHLRHWINAHPRTAIGILCFSSLLTLVGLAAMTSPARVKHEYDIHKQNYFYDLNTNELFAASTGEIPPIAAPSGELPDGGPAGVRAHVLQFFDGPKKGKPFVGWLETRDPDMEEDIYRQSRSARGADWGKGMLIRLPDGEDWVKADTPEGRAVIEKARRQDRYGNIPYSVYPE